MRSLVVAVLILGSIPFAFVRPVIGLYVYSLVSYMNPHRLTWGFAYNFPFALIMGAVTAVAWLCRKNESKKLPMVGGTVLILAMIVWVSLTTVFAIQLLPAYEMWTRVIKVLSVTVLVMIMINNRERIDGFLWIVVVSIGFFAVKGGIFALLSGGGYRIYGPPNSMISDNNSLAVATIMIVPLVRYLQINAKNKWISRGLLASMPIMIFSALSSYSRGALLAMTMMGGFMWLKSRHKMILGAGIILVAVAGITFMPEKWFDRMQTVETYHKDSSAMGRINAWHFAFNFTKDHPILGGGFQVFNVNSLWPKYAPDPKNQLNAHSIYFQVMAEQGFVGLILFLSAFVVAFRNGSRAIRLSKSKPELAWARDLAALVQVSLVGYAVGGAFLDLPYYDLPWNLCAILIICRVIVERELKLPRVSSEKVATASGAAAALPGASPVAPSAHPSFLRKSAPDVRPSPSYFRRN